MGGTTSVTLRKPDGEEFLMTRWTNSMPWGICNAKMFDSDEQHIDAYLEQWREMRDDYEKNRATGNYEFPMTACYFPSVGLAPCGYGLTVVDHVNKVILDMQGYCSFDSMLPTSIAMAKHQNNTTIGSYPEEDNDLTRFQELLESGRIKGVVTEKSFKEGRAFDELPSTDLQVLLPEICSRTFGLQSVYKTLTKDAWYEFVVDPSPFTIERFEEHDPKELIRMRQRVLDLGFTLTDEEEEIWQETVQEWKEEYEEEELLNNNE